MTDLLKAILTSWPLAILAIGLIYRRPIGSFFDRLLKLGFKSGAVELQAETDLTSRQKDAEKPPTNIVPTEEEVQKFERYLSSYPIVDELTEVVKAELARVHLERGSPRAFDVLVRQVAGSLWISWCERTYRLVFGSQIALLRKLNAGMMDMASIRLDYQKARSADPDFYRDYSFEEYMKFLTSQSLIATVDSGEKYGITQRGQQFLSWIATEKLPDRPH